MPAYSFNEQFVSKVESGEKNYTIRGKRKSRPVVGQHFYAYYAMRTKRCRKILESVITKVQDIEIHQWTVRVDGEILFADECEQLAIRDGFANFSDMMKFWDGRLPLYGDIIHWKNPKPKPEGPFPHVLTTWNAKRKGEKCKILPTGYFGEKVQIQFEDGETAIVNRMQLGSGRPKKYSEKRGRPRKNSDTLAAKLPRDEGDWE